MTGYYPDPLFGLHGVAIEHALDYEFSRHPAPAKKDLFLQVLFHDQGVSIAEYMPDILRVLVNERDQREIPDCFAWGSRGFQIVSGALKSIIQEKSSPCVEFFPVDVILRAIESTPDDWNSKPFELGEHLEDFWLMNCWNLLDVVDVDKSKLKWTTPFPGLVEKRPPWFTGWDQLEFKAPVECDLFGLKGGPHLRYVSPMLRDAINAAGLRAGVYSVPITAPKWR